MSAGAPGPIAPADAVEVGLVVIAFTALVVMHVSIALGLAARPPRLRALLAFVVAPLAPYLAWNAQMRRRAIAWCASLALYVIALLVAR